MNVIRFGCTTQCDVPVLRSDLFSSSKTFPATNEFSTLVAPAFRSLGYTSKFVQIQAPNGYTNLSDPLSLPSQLRDLAFDSYDDSLVMNTERFSVLNFTYPFLLDSLSFFIKKPPARSTSLAFGFLLHPFTPDMWAVVFGFIFALFAFKFLTQAAHLRLNQRLAFSVTVVDYLLDFALCGIICELYVARLTATATSVGSTLNELATIDHLTTHVESGEYALVVNSVVDFRFEFMNNSKNDDIRQFRAALEMHPPIVLKSRAKVCDYILGAKAQNDTRTYFTIDLEDNLLANCGHHLAEFVYVEIPSQAPMFVGFAFSPRVDALKQRVNKLIFAGFYATEVELNRRKYLEIKRARGIGIDNTIVSDNSAISSDDISETYWLYLAGTGLSVFVWLVENLLDQLRKRN